jgi:hypothetical protein
MTRRILLQWLAAAAGTLPIPALRTWAQTAAFPGSQRAALRDLAALVLPSSLGRDGTDRVAERFELWVREYRPGADMDHGYGFTRIRSKPPSPAPAYLAQLARLPQPIARADIEVALDEAKIETLPRLPDGKHIIADLMSFYFNSSEGYDLCYRAAIGRDRCRGLDGSDSPPPPLKGIA